jgi:uncharacterized protein (DUF1697 family)
MATKNAGLIVTISMLRGVNVGGHNKIKMEALRALYESLGLLDVQTYVQSGNVVFRTKESGAGLLGKRIETAIEKTFGFRPAVVLRNTSEMRAAIAKNPFASRQGIDPSKLLVTFLAGEPGLEARGNALAIKTFPEELRIDGREVYIYFPNGMARPKMSWPRIEKALKTSGTGRNWNTVNKLLEMAEALETLL